MAAQLTFVFLNAFSCRHKTSFSGNMEVGVEDKGLRVCVTDDSYSGISFELIQFILQLRAEISAFQIVNGTGKLLRFCIVCKMCIRDRVQGTGPHIQ